MNFKKKIISWVLTILIWVILISFGIIWGIEGIFALFAGGFLLLCGGGILFGTYYIIYTILENIKLTPLIKCKPKSRIKK